VPIRSGVRHGESDVDGPGCRVEAIDCPRCAGSERRAPLVMCGRVHRTGLSAVGQPPERTTWRSRANENWGRSSGASRSTTTVGASINCPKGCRRQIHAGLLSDSPGNEGRWLAHRRGSIRRRICSGSTRSVRRLGVSRPRNGHPDTFSLAGVVGRPGPQGVQETTNVIEAVYISDCRLPRSSGGTFDQGYLGLASVPLEVFRAEDNKYRITVRVRDGAAAVMTGVDMFGHLRACALPGPFEGWSPDPDECDTDLWREWNTKLKRDHNDGEYKEQLAAWEANPTDESEKSYYMKLSVACWGGSKLVQPAAGQACKAGRVICGSMCGAGGRYHIPHEQEFDAG